MTVSAVMRELIDQGLGMTRDMYMSESHFRQELSLVVRRSWQYAGHESQLRRPGQYIAVELGETSVIVARDSSGELNAFHNVCRHRGAQLVDAGCGSVRRFVCPYHQWSYGTDGSLRGASKMPTTLNKESFGLRPVHVRSWQGLILVNLSDDPEPITELFGESEDIIGPFGLADARVAHTIDYDVEANWKIVWENSQECYHCNANHPEFIRSCEIEPLAQDTYKATAIRRSPDYRVQTLEFPLREGAVSLTMDGAPASSKPMGRFAGGLDSYTAAVHLKPSFAMVCSPDYAMIMAERPMGVDTTRVSTTWLVAGDAVEGEHYDLDNLIKVWDATNRQDWELCERTQRGVSSPWYLPGPLAPGDESGVAGFHHAYAGMLAAAGL